MTLQDKINSLYEELIMLDEVAGELDPETNKLIDKKRFELTLKIKQLEPMLKFYGA